MLTDRWHRSIANGVEEKWYGSLFGFLRGYSPIFACMDRPSGSLAGEIAMRIRNSNCGNCHIIYTYMYGLAVGKI
jgi:hypothetical protein